ncbi:MAG: glycoside hydrolase family 55 protein [Opitutaceae bacterium]|jgi:hypothetical protein|nr:glycoside hydrolase family 55 protein [Opitutaceae bacterium]
MSIFFKTIGFAGGFAWAFLGAEPAAWLDVRDFGARGDGSADETAAFQSALDEASRAGAPVRVPPGRYRFDGGLRFPENAQLHGSWQHAGYYPGGQLPESLEQEGPRGQWGKGTVFLVHGGEGDAEGRPFITLGDNAELRGVVIAYPGMAWDAERRAPTAFPWTIVLKGDGILVENVAVQSAFRAIRIQKGPGHLLRNIWGTPVETGLFVDGTHEIGRLENIHFKNPRRLGGKAVPEMWLWASQNATGFVFGGTDWQYASNLFCWGYGTGYLFTSTPDGDPNGQFAGIGCDRAHRAVVVENCKPWGLSIANGEFVVGPQGAISGRAARREGLDKTRFLAADSDPAWVVTGARNAGSVRFSNCAFWGEADAGARIDGPGNVLFSGCFFRRWGGPEGKRAAFEVAGGALQVIGCQFNTDAPQFAVGRKALGVLATGNFHNGEWRVSDPGKRGIFRDNVRVDYKAPEPFFKRAKPGGRQRDADP